MSQASLFAEPSPVHRMSLFPPTRAHALERLDAFLPNTGRHYASERNTDYGTARRDNVSCLSPFVRHRLITEAEIAAKVLDRFALSTAEKFVQEVYWRTYFKGWLEARPQVWQRYTVGVRQAIDGLKGGQRSAYDAAVEGRTGIECYDAWATELIETGYLHNHARMWFASIWIFTLRLPWVLGADFFYRHLLDGDAASNTLSWRWVAGLHTAGKNYVARASNIRKHTDGRFFPEYQLAPDPAPLEDDWNGTAGAAPSLPELPALSGRSLLLLHEDDLGIETLPLEGVDVAGIAIIAQPTWRSPLEVSSLVTEFVDGAVADTTARAREKWSVEAVRVTTAEDVADHAGSVGASHIITPYMPVGPLKDQAGALTSDGAPLPVHVIQRGYDREAWPHCRKGFFGLKKKIPDLAAALTE